jgi:hypothetical protein
VRQSLPAKGNGGKVLDLEYLKRTYRSLFRQDDLVHFQVVVRQTDLDIGVRRERFSPELASWVEKLVQELREPFERYIKEHPAFLHSLEPCEPLAGAPPIAVDMAQAAYLAGVGPMAAVAGAFAQYTGRALARRSKDIIVENGGDIYLRSTRQRKIGIFAGSSPLSNRIALEIKTEDTVYWSPVAPENINEIATNSTVTIRAYRNGEKMGCSTLLLSSDAQSNFSGKLTP